MESLEICQDTIMARIPASDFFQFYSPSNSGLKNIVKFERESGLVSSRDSFTSWGEGASLTLVDYPSSEGVTVKIPYGIDVLLH